MNSLNNTELLITLHQMGQTLDSIFLVVTIGFILGAACMAYNLLFKAN